MHWGISLSTLGDITEYIGGCSVHWGDTMSAAGDIMMSMGGIMSTAVGVQYTGGYHDECGGYHEYIGGCSVHWGFHTN